MKHYIKPFLAIVLTVGLLAGFKPLDKSLELDYSSVETYEENGTTFTVYSNPDWGGTPLGWDMAPWPHQYFVADCWCRAMGHDAYQQVALYQQQYGTYFTYLSNKSGTSKTGYHRRFIKVTCRGGSGHGGI